MIKALYWWRLRESNPYPLLETESRKGLQKMKEKYSKELENHALAGFIAILDQINQASEARSKFDGADIKVARKQFADFSKAIISYYRDYNPQPVVDGELHLFECPMANDPSYAYGYKLWIQKKSELANPYMGQMMPT